MWQEAGSFDPLAFAPTLVVITEPFHPNSDIGMSFHHLNYDSTAPELQGPYGRAVRYSAGVMIPNWQHGWCHNVLPNPPLPHEPKEQVATSVLNCARVVQREAIYIERSGDYTVRPMNDEEFALMTSREVLMVEGGWQQDGGRYYRNRIGFALATCAVDCALEEGSLPPSAVEQFVSTHDPDREHELGNLLVSGAVQRLLDTIKPMYDEAVRRDMVPTGTPDLFATAHKLFMNDRYPDYHEVLKERLLETVCL